MVHGLRCVLAYASNNCLHLLGLEVSVQLTVISPLMLRIHKPFSLIYNRMCFQFISNVKHNFCNQLLCSSQVKFLIWVYIHVRAVLHINMSFISYELWYVVRFQSIGSVYWCNQKKRRKEKISFYFDSKSVVSYCRIKYTDLSFCWSVSKILRAS